MPLPDDYQSGDKAPSEGIVINENGYNNVVITKDNMSGILQVLCGLYAEDG
jgi:hypothetical protein